MMAIIAALTKDNVIGKAGKLPWHISDDLKNFRKLTSGNSVVMGRKTFESIGKPLPNRHNIVVSSSLSVVPGIDVCSSLEDALEKAKSYGRDIFIIGGANLYQAAVPLVDKLYLSHVKESYDGDTYFPKIDFSQWNVESRQDFPEFELVVYKRK